MKTWIGAMALASLMAAGSPGTVNVASAAEVITVPRTIRHAAPVSRSQHAYRYDRYAERRYDDRYNGGWTYYYGRPYFYAPAPFPLGFDFGFGW